MFTRSCVFSLMLLAGQFSHAQILVSENFETASLSSSWQIISGNWHIADVQQLRIAPAENGRQYVLRSDSAGLIRLFVDIPGSVKASRLQLRFSYYTYSNAHGLRIETEFYKKEMKDGLRGKPWRTNLAVKGMWTEFTKVLPLPANANSFRIVFSNPRSSPKGKSPCLDVITVFLLK